MLGFYDIIEVHLHLNNDVTDLVLSITHVSSCVQFEFMISYFSLFPNFFSLHFYSIYLFTLNPREQYFTFSWIHLHFNVFDKCDCSQIIYTFNTL